jgi:hypothetical protein
LVTMDGTLQPDAMKPLHLLPIGAAFLASCAQLHQTEGTQDGVYDRPEPAVLRAAPLAEAPPQGFDDYYDTATARSEEQSYYDVAYNDPYYYNYDRFGFSVGLSYANYGGWGYPAYGFGMGYTWGAPMYGWGSPWGYGGCCGSWGYPWGYDPWYGGYYGGIGYPGYGYWGYGGGCYGCYQPLVVCGGSWLTVAPRPVLGGGGVPTGPTGGSEGTWDGQLFRPQGQRSLVNLRLSSLERGSGGRPVSVPTMTPEKIRPGGRPSAGTGTQRSGDRSSGSWDRGGGGNGRQGGGMPSFGSGGGGGSPVISPRPR